MEAELFHADGRTDITKLIVAFRNFANSPNKRTHRRNDSLQPRRNKLQDCEGKLQSNAAIRRFLVYITLPVTE